MINTAYISQKMVILFSGWYWEIHHMENNNIYIPILCKGGLQMNKRLNERQNYEVNRRKQRRIFLWLRGRVNFLIKT